MLVEGGGRAPDRDRDFSRSLSRNLNAALYGVDESRRVLLFPDVPNITGPP